MSEATKEIRCVAVTKRGAPCKSWPAPGSARCVSHAPERAEAMHQARSRGATNANRLRALEGRRAKLDTPAALVKFVGILVQDVVGGAVEPDVARVALYGCSIQRQLLETTDLEQRLAALEAAAEQPTRRTGKWR